MKNPILFKFILKNLWWMALITFVTITAGLTRAIGASYVGKTTDLITSGSIEGLVSLVVIGFAFMFSAYFSRWLAAVTCLYLTEKLALETRIKLVEHIEKMSFLIFEKNSSGYWQSIIRNDVTVATELIYNLFSRILNNVFLFIFSVYYMYITSPKATIVVVISCIGMGVINQNILKKIKNPQMQIRKSLGNITSSIENTFLSIDTIKTFSAKDFVISQFKKQKKIYNENGMHSEKIDSLRLMLYNLVNNLAIFISLFYLGVLAINNELSIGSVFMFIYLLKQIFVPVEVIFRWMSNIVKSNIAWSRIYEVLEMPKEMDEENKYSGELNNVNIKNIFYSFGEKEKIINDMNVNLFRKKLNVLVGQSGSGKSTLLKILLGLYRSKEATIQMNDKPVSIKSLNGLASFSASGTPMLNMSIYENLSLGDKRITKEMCLDLCIKLGLYNWISSLPDGIDTILYENATNISGGQKQMLSNMRAILAGYPIIIMDEPFSALDKEREANFMLFLQSLKNERIILFTSHRDTTLNDCDNKILL